MSAKTPIRTVVDGSNNPTGLAEFQSGEFVALTHGGLGASLSIGSAGQVLKVNSGASALEFGNVEAVFNIDGMTDGSGITIADGDDFAISDNGTEKKINASQIATYVQSGISGDITISSGTAAIGSGVIVNADVNASAAIAVSKTALTAGTGISLSTNTLNVDAAQTGITSLLATDIKIGEDNETKIDFETADEIHFYAANAEQVFVSDGVFGPQTDSDVDLGTTSARFKDAFVDSVTVTDNVTIGGNLTVNGTTTTVNSTTVTIDDPIFTLGGDSAPGSDDNKDRGIEFRYHTGSAAKVGFFGFDDSTGKFTFIPDATNSSEVFSGTAGTVVATTFEGALTGNVTGNVSGSSGSTTGNAATATALANARTIAGQSFDGTGNITIASTDLSNTSNITLNDASQTLTNKTLTSPVISTITGSTITLDSAGDINLDADGADIILKDGGTEFGRFTNDSTDFIIKSAVSDKDIKIQGNDGGSTITALTLDMSAAGNATFNNNIMIAQDAGSTTGKILLGAAVDGETGDLEVYHDGNNSHIRDRSSGDLRIRSTKIVLASDSMSYLEATNSGSVDIYHNSSKKFETTSAGATVTGALTADGGLKADNITIDGTEIDLSSGDLTIDVAGDISLDADGGNVYFKDAGASILSLNNVSQDVVLKSEVNDKDFIIQGVDNGSAITALTLDMSDAGAATFNDKIIMGTNKEIQFVDTNESIKSDGSKLIVKSGGTTFNFPTADGSDGQALVTDGSGTFSFADAGSSGFSSSTITTTPGAVNFDLAKTNNAGSAETPFDTTATDAFGSAVGSVFDCMEPIGSSTANNVDLGSSESHLGA